MSRSVGRTLLIVAAAAIALTIAAAVWVMGGPGSQRERRMDERRIDDLRTLQDAIVQHQRETGALPANLLVLAKRPGLRIAVSDPLTRAPYGYHVDAADRYRLCADFSTDTGASPLQRGWSAYDLQWAHGAGTTCFERRIDPPDTPGKP